MEYPYQLVVFFDKVPRMGEFVYQGDNGWYPQVALKRRFAFNNLSEEEGIAKVQAYITSVAPFVITFGERTQPADMPVAVIEVVDSPEVVAFHREFIKCMDQAIISKFPEREDANYYPHMTITWKGEEVVDTEEFVGKTKAITKVWILKDDGQGGDSRVLKTMALHHEPKSYPGFSIERPQVEDAAEIAKMHNQSWRDTYPNKELGVTGEYIESLIAKRETPEGIVKRQSAIKRSYDDSPYFLRIAKDEQGTVVGMIDGFNRDGSYELAGLYTAVATHGSGVGRALWDSFNAWTNGSKNVWLTVVTYNERAKAFYRKLGFREVAGTTRLYEGTTLPVQDMALSQ